SVLIAPLPGSREHPPVRADEESHNAAVHRQNHQQGHEVQHELESASQSSHPHSHIRLLQTSSRKGGTFHLSFSLLTWPREARWTMVSAYSMPSAREGTARLMTSSCRTRWSYWRLAETFNESPWRPWPWLMAEPAMATICWPNNFDAYSL